MNYLIFDTEQTYNYGYIVVNEQGEQLHRKNLVLTNNFENRNIIGENTYKRKKPIFEKDPDVQFVISSDGANAIKTVIKDYNINYIISHNVSEDRRQLENLSLSTGVKFDETPFYDSINLVKVLFPNNTQTSLESIVSDISGVDVKQTHTALQDCDLLYNLIFPIIEYMPIFIKYQEIFAHDGNYEITYNFFTKLKSLTPFPRTMEEIQEVLNYDTDSGKKRICSNFLKDIAKNYHFWEIEEYTKYGKKGDALKTPGLKVVLSKNVELVEDLYNISALFLNLDKISDTIITSCVKHQSAQETDEVVLAKLEKYKEILKEEYCVKYSFDKKALEEEYNKKNIQMEEEYNKRYQLIFEREEVLGARLFNMLNIVFNEGFFGSEKKKIKTMLANKDRDGIFKYFLG